MSRIGFVYAVLAIAALIGGPGAAEAQRPSSNSSSSRPQRRSSSYRPGRPTLSPYLQLFRSDPGQILPSYQTFVQPRVEARKLRRLQDRNVQNLQQGLRQVQQSQQFQNTSGTIQSGIGSGFQTHSQHFRIHSQFFRTHR
jgi:hypothetical protein